MSIRTLHVQYVGNNLHIHDWHERDVAAITTNDGREWVPIVRCRDCEYMHTVQSWLGEDVDECWFHADPERTEPDGFCKWGERRGDA